MTASHCQWRYANASVGLACLSKDVTDSDIFYFLIFHLMYQCSDQECKCAPMGEHVTLTGAVVFFFNKITEN
jgi:hypothetical protein